VAPVDFLQEDFSDRIRVCRVDVRRELAHQLLFAAIIDALRGE
jgi:hypothetical protein